MQDRTYKKSVLVDTVWIFYSPIFSVSKLDVWATLPRRVYISWTMRGMYYYE